MDDQTVERGAAREPAVRARALPLVGREVETAELRAALARGGCVVTGAAGVGKTRLVREAAVGAPRTVELLASASAGTVPYGVLAQALPPGEQSAGVPAAPAESFLRLLSELPGRGRPLLVVDDAHELDPATAALLLTVVSRRIADVLVTVRTGSPAPDAVTALWKDLGLHRIVIEPLEAADTTALVRAVLADEVNTRAFHRIHDLAGGNPLYTVELVLDGLRTGALAQDRGRWQWHENRLQFDRLSVLIERRITGASAEAIAALELLAVGGPLPLAVLDQLGRSGAVEELELLDLAELRPADAGGVVVPVHPLLTEVVAGRLPGATAVRLRRELAAGFTAVFPDDDRTRLRVALWRLESGQPDDGSYAAASELAMRSGNPELALTLAESAEPSPLAALARSSALIGLSRFDEAAAVLTEARDEAAVLPEPMGVFFAEQWFRAHHSGTCSEERVLAVVEDVGGWHPGASWQAFTDTLRAWTLQHSGHAQDAVGLLAPWREDTSLDAYRRFHLLSALYFAELKLGMVDASLATADQVGEAIQTVGGGPWLLRYAERINARLPRIRAARRLVDVEHGLERCREEARREGDAALGSSAAFALGVAALRRGHASRAESLLQEAADVFEVADFGSNRFECLAQLALARSLLGDGLGARRALEEADAVGAGQPRFARRHGEVRRRAEAVVDAVAHPGRSPVAALLEQAEASADALLDRADAAYDAFRFGAPLSRVQPLLAPLADRTGSELVAVCCAHVEAARDPDALMTAAAAFDGLGVDLYAAEAYAAAGRLYRAQEKLRPALAAAEASAAHRERCGPVVSRILDEPSGLPQLSPRELDVARLVARGLTNREIADELVLSVRTVESTVLRACRRHGLGGRAELGALVASAG